MTIDFNPGKIKLIIGLGNPGKQYENAYHNVGHLFAGWLGSKAIKTDCFMNNSGGFIKTALKKRKIRPEELLVVHDESDLGLGDYKLNFGRGSAGHKGVESIIKALKTKNFWRLRIGIRPIGPIGPIGRIRRLKADEFVLKKISAADKKILEKTFSTVLAKMKA